jgi:fucose permease
LLPTVLCLVWIAFSYGTVYPTTVALTAAAFADDRGKAVSALVAMGSIGAATLPWAAGLLLRENAGAAYPWSVALGLAVLLILLVGIQRGLQRTSIASGG